MHERWVKNKATGEVFNQTFFEYDIEDLPPVHEGHEEISIQEGRLQLAMKMSDPDLTKSIIFLELNETIETLNQPEVKTRRKTINNKI